jgi:hypothetical protein
MLARFGAAGRSQTSSQHAVSAVTPQRAIINIASAGSVCYTNELAAGVHMHTPSLMMLARFGAADCSQTSSQHAVSAVTHNAIINIAVQVQPQMN